MIFIGFLMDFSVSNGFLMVSDGFGPVLDNFNDH